MAKIENRYVDGIGDCEIHFSLKSGFFEIRPPKEVADKISGTCNLNGFATWEDVSKGLNDVKVCFHHEVLLTRKVIIIQLQTSISNWKIEKEKLFSKEKELVETDDKLFDGNGFIIKWYIAEEYSYPNNKLKYRLIDSCSHLRGGGKINADNSKINHLGQLILGGGELRMITYREDLHNWLLTLDKQIEDMLSRLISFFDVDTQKFLSNFENTQLRLGSGNE